MESNTLDIANGLFCTSLLSYARLFLEQHAHPPTFLQGMNFNPMPSVNDHSDALFWQLAIPVIVVLVPLRRYLHYLKKRTQGAFEKG